MNKRIIILIFVFVATLYPQTKYYIYFKDKGITKTEVLQKSSSIYKIAEQQLSQKAIERRKQVLGANNYITYEDLPLTDNYVQGVQSLGVKIINQLRWFNAVTAYLDDNQFNTVKNLSYVEKVEAVAVLKGINDKIESTPIPQGTNQQKDNNILKKTTGLDYGGSLIENSLSDIPAVHALGIKGTGVYIGMLDDGTSYKLYNALKTRKVIKEYDYVHHRNYVSNQGGHGSCTFCLLGGYDPGNAIGPSYDSQFFLAETEIDSVEINIEEDNYAAALQDMESAGVEITTSSLGYNTFDTGQKSYTYSNMNGNTTICAKAVNIAFNLGMTCFNSAGNERGGSWGYIVTPADAFNVIAVGAVDAKKQIASFSSYGPTSDGRIKPEICAMGSNNWVAAIDGVNYTYGSGTSFSTPISAGIAGLLKSAWPHLTNVQIRNTFLECCYPQGTPVPNNDYGYGIISATKVIAYPNLSMVDSITFKLNKIFIDSKGINSSSVKLFYRTGSNSYQSVSMNYDGTLKYNYQLPNSPKNTILEFYFTYTETTGGASVHEPASGTYKFAYGSLNVSNLTAVNTVAQLPTSFILYQNYPNPFNPTTSISYDLPVSGNIKLKVYDILGREVATLVDAFQQAGNYKAAFNGSQFTSGVYFYRLSISGNQAGSYSAVKKMILIK